MINLKHIEDSVPGPRYEHIRIDDLVISRSIFSRGQWQIMEFPEDVAFCDLGSRHIQTFGTFEDESGVLPARLPGWTSESDYFVVPAGRYKRVARDTVEVWCCRSKDGDASRAHCIDAQAGLMTLPKGTNLLIVSGLASAAGRQFGATKHINVASESAVISVDAPMRAFIW